MSTKTKKSKNESPEPNHEPFESAVAFAARCAAVMQERYGAHAVGIMWRCPSGNDGSSYLVGDQTAIYGMCQRVIVQREEIWRELIRNEEEG